MKTIQTNERHIIENIRDTWESWDTQEHVERWEMRRKQRGTQIDIRITIN